MSAHTYDNSKGATAQKLTPMGSNLLQRSCGCGGKSNLAGGCEQCKQKQKTLQRKSVGEQENSSAPAIVNEVLRSPGTPLDPATRSFMEPRFGHDFSQVSIHADARGAESAQAVNALAYTVGRDIVFGAGQYAPRSSAGLRTLAHELAHVVQQGGSTQLLSRKRQSESSNNSGAQHADSLASSGAGTLRIGKAGDSYEREADAVADAVMNTSAPPIENGNATPGVVQRLTAPLLQRRLVINPADTVPSPPPRLPTPLTTAVQGLLGDTCPDGHFQVNATTGVVTAQNAVFCQQPPPPGPYMTPAASSTPVGCACICDVINSAQTATIAFRAGAPGTSPGSVAGAGPGQGGVATSPTVSADPRFRGQYLINGNWVDIPFHLIFAHELCGHALPKMQGTHAQRSGVVPPQGTPDAERRAVDVERQIAAEHNPPLPRRPEDYAGGARERP